jgi:hypothetical protein
MLHMGAILYSQSIYEKYWVILGEIMNVYVNVTYGCCSQSKYENIEWDNICSYKCYIWVLFSK